MKSDKTLSCLICDKELVNIHNNISNQPNYGVVCKTYGNYGSGVYDSFTEEYLEFNLCDSCLIKASRKNQIIVTTKTKDRKLFKLDENEHHWRNK